MMTISIVLFSSISLKSCFNRVNLMYSTRLLVVMMVRKFEVYARFIIVQ
jgi:hypothetical protein